MVLQVNQEYQVCLVARYVDGLLCNTHLFEIVLLNFKMHNELTNYMEHVHTHTHRVFQELWEGLAIPVSLDHKEDQERWDYQVILEIPVNQEVGEYLEKLVPLDHLDPPENLYVNVKVIS